MQVSPPRAGRSTSERSPRASTRRSSPRRRRASRSASTSSSRAGGSGSSSWRTTVHASGRAVPRHLRPVTSTGNEQGLLSAVFHPRYASNGLFYVNYTDLEGDTRVVEFRRSETDDTSGGEEGAALRSSALRQSQRRAACLRARRSALRGHGGRWLRRRSRESRAGSLQQAGEAPPARRRRAQHPVGDVRLRAAGTRGGSRSIGLPETSGSAT